jgi:hypothetical protein
MRKNRYIFVVVLNRRYQALFTLASSSCQKNGPSIIILSTSARPEFLGGRLLAARAPGWVSSLGERAPGSWRRSRVGSRCGSYARPARLLGEQAPGSWQRSTVWLLARGGLDSRRCSPTRHLAVRSTPGRRAPLKLAPRLAAWRRGLLCTCRRGPRVLGLRWGIKEKTRK